jgi:hypothetical protein
MKLAIMQPYFFPYIGYWQLISAVDAFVLLDDVQYIRHGWVNRNRVLKHGGGWQYIMIPLQKHAVGESIKNIRPNDSEDWKSKILRQLEHYNYRGGAPFYGETEALLREIFSKISNENLTGINAIIIRELCRHLEIGTQLMISSEKNFDYRSVSDPGDWALSIAVQMQAQEYINPIGGKDLFDPDKFSSHHVELSFLKSDEITYRNAAVFEPWLSIVDVLMFNGRKGTQALLPKYTVQSVQ